MTAPKPPKKERDAYHLGYVDGRNDEADDYRLTFTEHDLADAIAGAIEAIEGEGSKNAQGRGAEYANNVFAAALIIAHEREKAAPAPAGTSIDPGKSYDAPRRHATGRPTH
jgi:hypothetical protein